MITKPRFKIVDYKGRQVSKLLFFRKGAAEILLKNLRLHPQDDLKVVMI